jgi:hypothetical protein
LGDIVTPEQKQEELSRAYLQAVAAKCGFALGTWSQDQRCIDATIGAAGLLGTGSIADPKLDVQLKCTANRELVRADHISIQVKRKQYDHLVARSHVPKILVVLLLPEDEQDWVVHSEEQLALRRCAYYARARDFPATTTAESPTLRVPLANHFSPDALSAMLLRVSRGEAP